MNIDFLAPVRAISIAVLVWVASAPASEIVRHNFGIPPNGANPYGGVIRDAAGNLYGTAYSGGAANVGVVYKVDATGRLTVLHNFTGGADGANPSGGVIGDSAGNLYGTTYYGGMANAGAVYKVDAKGHETVLYSFTGGGDGGGPSAGVVRDSAGNLYGTTVLGGAAGSGVVYKVDTSGNETVLYSFTGGGDGGSPYDGVILDSSGNLYGTAQQGGTGYAGVVFKLDTAGHENVLYSFTAGADGGYPFGGVIRDRAGNLYGTTYRGGAGYGVVYKIDSTGHQAVLYSFTGEADGCHPHTGVIRDSAGNLYGTTHDGGAAGAGVVYKLSATGQQTVLHSFTGGADGGSPYAAVIRDEAGNLYATAYAGGTAGWGVVYKVDPAGLETVLSSFPGSAGGSSPFAGVLFDSSGNLYGTTEYGGRWNAGVVFKVDTAGRETALYSFTGGTDGGNPYGGVIRDAEGNLYGSTYYGGAAGRGAVYKVDTAGHQTVLYNFTGGADGGNPYAGVILDSSGNIYGTTYLGGAGGFGVVYKVDTTGQETVLYSFTGGTDGANPRAGVVRDPAGNLYGTTYRGGSWAAQGVVYKVDTTGNETVLHTFSGYNDGGGPESRVIRDSAGNLYGTTYAGGMMGAGVVYRIDTTGQETVLYTFLGGTDGFGPVAGVIRDSAGNLYGTTYHGGTSNAGVVYKIDTMGHETVLYTFTGGTDGGSPYAGLIRDAAGHLFGTTYHGGTKGTGVVFEIKP